MYSYDNTLSSYSNTLSSYDNTFTYPQFLFYLLEPLKSNSSYLINRNNQIDN